jgi:hypothetical protein
MAWLHTAPESEHTGKGKQPDPVTRVKAMEGRGEHPRFPPVAHQYLVRWWLDIGPTMPAGMGDAPLPLRYIADEMGTLGVDIGPWEAQAIRAMSRAFISERHEARKRGHPAPYSEELPKEVQDRVTSQFAALVAAMGRRKG